ncbi:MAG: hypothetical protein RLZZ416_189 [Candidatus Parcubacteria bacterium]|jgi:dihydrofolate reductase
MKVSAIAAIGRNRELGKDNKLIWKIPDDLKRLRQLTLGHPVIMGRKTFDSIIVYRGRPLVDRPNIVVTRDEKFAHEGVLVVYSVEEAIEKGKAAESDEAFIIGGAQIFEASMPRLDKLYLTLIDAEDPEADSFFPPYEQEFTKKVFEEAREWDGLAYHWIDLERG